MNGLQRICTGLRLLLGLVVAIGLLAYHNLSQNQAPTMAGSSASSPIDSLKLSLAQVPDASPTTVKVTVTNTGSGPITVLDYDSPLDPSALQLGLLSITPAGASAPLDLPVVQFRRIWPPGKDQLISIAPSESADSEIFFRPAIVPPEDLGEKATVQIKGEWTAVWAKTKDEISDGELNDPRGSPGVFQGSFASEPLEVTVIP